MTPGIYDYGYQPMNFGSSYQFAPTFNSVPQMNGSIWNTTPTFSSTSSSTLSQTPTAEELALAEKEKKIIEEMNASGLGLTNEEMEILKKIAAKRTDSLHNQSIGSYIQKDGISMAGTALFLPMVSGWGKNFGLHHIAEANCVQQTGAFCKKYSGYEWASNTKVGQATGKFMNYGVNKADAVTRYANMKWGGEGVKWTGKLAKGLTTGSASLTKGVINYGGWAAAATTVIDDGAKLKTAYKKDFTTGLKQTGQTAVKAAGAAVGTWAGAKGGAAVGAKVGGLIGSIFPGAGNVIGAAIGGAIGAIGGALLGGWAGKKASKAVVGKDVADKVSEENITKAGEMTKDENGVQYAQASEEQVQSVQDIMAWAQMQDESTFTPEEMAVLQKLSGAAA